MTNLRLLRDRILRLIFGKRLVGLCLRNLVQKRSEHQLRVETPIVAEANRAESPGEFAVSFTHFLTHFHILFW
jgi:hypothetical protein